MHKAERPVGVDKSARVNGGIYLRLLTKKNNLEEKVDAEIRHRDRKVSKKKLKKLKPLTLRMTKT